ncbi:hypothetical protein BHM03_00047136 [Ensete ventricosum]|nr:hypothetical protein BHM03_00047136 [Ensete ventricosum]
MASSTAGVIIPFCEAIKLSFQELLTVEANSVADTLHSAVAFYCSRSSTSSTALSPQPKVTHRSAIDLLLPPLLPAIVLSSVACHSAVFSSNTHTLRSSTPRSRTRICRRLLPLLQQEEYWFLATPRRALVWCSRLRRSLCYLPSSALDWNKPENL